MSGKMYIFQTFLAFLALILVISMVICPEATFNGANYGLKTWATILVPALFPFFIIADIIIELGIVNFLGVILEPLMRPVFKLPGTAGFVLAMGFTSGFPMGAVLTNSLYEKNMCTKEEASRLIAFTNNSSPLFLLVAIPIGMFNNPKLGLLLLITHYTSNILLGIFLGFLKKRDYSYFKFNRKNNILISAFKEMLNKQQKSYQSIGKLLGTAVEKSIKNMLMIGGFVIFFSVLIEVFNSLNLLNFITYLCNKVLLIIGISPNLSEGLSTGFFEMTLGTKKISEINAPLINKIEMVSFILGWSGLSIQAQVLSIVGQNNIPIHYYFWGRIFQGICATLLTGILFSFFIKTIPALQFDFFIDFSLTIWNFYLINFIIIFFVFILLILISLICYIISWNSV